MRNIGCCHCTTGEKMIDDYIVKSLKVLNKVQYELDEYLKTETSLIYPQKNEPKKSKPLKRISEQEAKILLCHILLQEHVVFSLETPTVEKYSFTGNKKISGNLDLCIYEIRNVKYYRSNCIEYKAHNMSKTYKNDFQKLLREQGDNYFIHILQSADNYTLCSAREKNSKGKPVINKYLSDINDILKTKTDLDFNTITLYICVLSPFLIIKKKIYKSELTISMNDKYCIKENSIIINNQNWELVKNT